tara:strand:- start:7898 stop:8188 length:291 start_codon:yes stop_codon:yes gene_type:complete
MIPTTPQEYEHKNCVVVPLVFFDKLMRCYYGTGPRDGDLEYQPIPQNLSTEVIPEISKLKDITIEAETPRGYSPRGIAAEKLKAKDGTRHHKTTKK